MDFSFLLRHIFIIFVDIVCYFLVEVYRALQAIRKSLENIEKHLERTNEAESESVGLSFPNGTTFDVQLKGFG